ncbi:hypothetical protein JB92DRAFT_3092116 [Gautieria morchelliformis]|nr:hypothetical protein JB92DRAFT_3092116 [Gautieria morchelliformis]
MMTSVSSVVSVTLGNDLIGQSPKCISTCTSDPFKRPGTLVAGPHSSDTRWIPFSPVQPLNSSNIDYNAPVPRDALELASPQYMKLMSQSNQTSDMDWVKNKTVLFIGSSHDRNNIQYLCEELHGAYSSVGGHVAGFCNVTTHHLVLAFWFTYGSIDSDAYDWFSPPERRPLTFESRIEQVMLPWMAKQSISKPDLVIETSLFWDDGFLNQLCGHQNCTSRNQPLTYFELAWHRSRVHELVAYTRTLYGKEIPIMFRTRHVRESNTYNRIMRIFQLDQNLRMVARELDVKLFRWGNLLEGVTTFYDGDQHFQRGPTTWLFGDMVLFYLRQATIPGCWECFDELD